MIEAERRRAGHLRGDRRIKQQGAQRNRQVKRDRARLREAEIKAGRVSHAIGHGLRCPVCVCAPDAVSIVRPRHTIGIGRDGQRDGAAGIGELIGEVAIRIADAQSIGTAGECAVSKERKGAR